MFIKKEYMTKWNPYKITSEAYERYTKDIIYGYRGTKKENRRFIKKLFSDKNFEDSKYSGLGEWINLSQFV